MLSGYGLFLFFFFFNDPATTEIYTLSDTLSLHDALPICVRHNRLCNSEPLNNIAICRLPSQRSNIGSMSRENECRLHGVFCIVPPSRQDRGTTHKPFRRQIKQYPERISSHDVRRSIQSRTRCEKAIGKP